MVKMEIALRFVVSLTVAFAFGGLSEVAVGDSGPGGSEEGRQRDRKEGNRKEKSRERLSLREVLSAQGVQPLGPPPAQNPDHVALGQMLFFDWELSGNRNIACATCHHPTLGTADGLSLSVGTSHVSPGFLGPDRVLEIGKELMPRNAPDVFNRGSLEWSSQFWDSRLVATPTGFISPAGDQLPTGMPNILSVQAMFPVTSRDEMRGHPGDLDSFGQPNELALIADEDFSGQWEALANRLLAIPEYRTLFAAAFPNVPLDDIGFEHAAIAIAAFEIEAYTLTDSPWDRFVAGNNQAISTAQKRGAKLFYGKANCSTCHSGTLFTDQKHYNIGVPQLGPGKGGDKPFDHGRARETGRVEDKFCFRTPPLRNVTETGPYMHNGAYAELEDVIRHHVDPLISLLAYDPDEFIEQNELINTFEVLNQSEVAVTIMETGVPALSNNEIQDLVSFLKTLTATDIQRRLQATVPQAVPSGLMDQVSSSGSGRSGGSSGSGRSGNKGRRK